MKKIIKKTTTSLGESALIDCSFREFETEILLIVFKCIDRESCLLVFHRENKGNNKITELRESELSCELT